MSYRLRYKSGTKYAHLNSAAFPRRFPTPHDAAIERARIVASCGDRDDIEISEEED